MILTPHAIVGATLANLLPEEPLLGFSIAYISHYLLDVLPHVDYKINNFLDDNTKSVKSIIKNASAALDFLYIFFDFIFAVLICSVLFIRSRETAVITFIGLIGGVLPDFFQFLYYKYKIQPFIILQKIHDVVHHTFFKSQHEEKSFYYIWGILLQFLLPTIFIIIYYFAK